MRKFQELVAIILVMSFPIIAQSQSGQTQAKSSQRMQIEDFRVNDDATGADQVEVAMAIASDGSFMIVWEDGRNGTGDIYGQRYNSNGTPLGSNFRVNTNTGTRNFTEPAIAVDGFDRYIVTWDNRVSGNDIFAQRYASNGSTIGGNFQVNSGGGGSQILPAVDAHSDGSFVIVWQDTRNGNVDIYGQRYDDNGNPIESNFMINDGSGIDQRLPTVSIAGTGQFVVVWWDDRETNNSALTNIYGQRYSSSGGEIGNNFRIDQDRSLSLRVVPEVATDAAGNFVVVWYDDRNGDNDIFGRRFRSDGVAQSNDFKINDPGASDNEQYFASIGMDDAGNFVVAWQNGEENATLVDLSAQKYNSNGVRIGSNYKIGQDNGVPIQRKPDVKLVDNTVYVAWEDNRLGGRGIDIYARTDLFEQQTPDHIKIVAGTSGDGAELGSTSLTADQTLTVHAASYDASGNYLGDVQVSWSSTGTLAPAVSGFGTFITFSPTTAPTSGTIVASHGTLGSDATGAISVTVGVKFRVRILTGFSGKTSELKTASLTVGQTLQVHAASFDRDENYIADEAVNWSVSGGIGTFNPVNGISTTFTATAAGSGQITADHTGSLFDATSGLITVTAPPLNYIKIITGASGDGSELADTTLSADDNLVLHAAGYSASGIYLGDEVVTWTSTGTLAPAISTTASSITFDPTTAPASGTIVATHATAGVDVTGTISVTPGEPVRVRVLHDGSGATEEVQTADVVAGSSLAMHAGSFDADSNYIMDTAVNWSVSGNIGMLSSTSNSTSTIFTATTAGTGMIIADHATLVDDATGLITVESGPPATIRIVPGIGGDGVELADTSITADQTLTVHAAAYDVAGNYVGDEQVSWSSTDSLAPVISRNGSSIVFAPTTAPASGKIVATHATAGSDSTGLIAVSVGEEQSIKILAGASGETNEEQDAGLMIGDSLVVHASSFDGDNNYITDVSVSWGVTNNIGTVDPAQGVSTIFRATVNDTGRITASHAELGGDTTGRITVSAASPPMPPQNLQAEPGNAEVTLTWDANSEPDFVRYRIYMDTSANPTTQIDSVGGADSTSRTITGLNNGTTYYFRLKAVDQEMQASAFSNEANATPMENPDIIPPQISHTQVASPVPGDQQVTITASITDAESGVRSAALHYRTGGAASFTTLAMPKQGSTTYGTDIPANDVTLHGLEYYLSAQDSAGNSATAPANVPDENPSVIRVSTENLTFPASTPAGAYRMISVPLDLDEKRIDAVLADNLGNYDDTVWRFFRYKNNTNVEYGSLNFSTDRFAPGAGFWLITKNGTQLDAGAGASVSTASSYSITLQSGWNQIGNPFNFPVNWSEVERNGSVEDQLVGYAGSVNELSGYDMTRTRIEPFEGYFVNNMSASAVTIEIPAKAANDGSALPKSPPALLAQQILAAGEWWLQITATSGHFIDRHNFLGHLHDAEAAYDRHDLAEPPFFATEISLFFPHHDWPLFANNYSSDFRPPTESGAVWDFQVKTARTDPAVTLTLAAQHNLPSDWQMRLHDLTSGTQQDLQKQPSYRYQPHSGEAVRRFRLLVGQGDFVAEQQARSDIPTDFVLQQNYPNPFNPETLINYQLPISSDIELAIYEITGRLVRTLVAGQVAAGSHRVVWDGRDDFGARVPSGVYVLRLQAGDASAGSAKRFVQMRKMVLAR